jgi:hypothetical protein
MVCLKGKCECVYEPRGDNGLEGFMLNTIYIFEKMKDKKGIYFRIYLSSDYYETCGPVVFRRYFKEASDEANNHD